MTCAPRLAALLGALIPFTSVLEAQQQAPVLIQQAVTLIRERQVDSADVLLRTALDTGTVATRGERQTAWVWRAVIAHFRDDDSVTRRFFRNALAYDTTLTVGGLAALSPTLDSIFLDERRDAFFRVVVHAFAAVDEPPRRISGPPVAYPPALYARPVTGSARVLLIVDGAGRAESTSVQVFEAPDSMLVEPLKAMVRASQFAPGRLKGRPVRVWLSLRIEVRPPRFSAAELVRQARALAAQRRGDSAVALLDLALGPLAGPSEAERAYALLARGVARAAAGPDTLARRDYRHGLALIDSVRGRGVELAPFVLRLADSVRRATMPRAALAPPRTVGGSGGGGVAQTPALLSHPPLQYPPEARQLGVGGTVVVEVAVDTAGRVEPQTARVLQTTNPIFNAEALRVVRAARYRPARADGRPVRVVIQQPVTFVEY